MRWRLFRKPAPAEPVRPRVTPHPEQAAALERRRNELAYYPENGFHRDRIQERIDTRLPALLRRQAS